MISEGSTKGDGIKAPPQTPRPNINITPKPRPQKSKLEDFNYLDNRILDFRIFGYATGNYVCRCSSCSKQFVGDKRAFTCLECAIKQAELLRENAELNRTSFFSFSVDYNVTVNNVQDIPIAYYEDFQEWLQSRAVDVGAGYHEENFSIDEHYENDIVVKFRVDNKINWIGE